MEKGILRLLKSAIARKKMIQFKIILLKYFSFNYTIIPTAFFANALYSKRINFKDFYLKSIIERSKLQICFMCNLKLTTFPVSSSTSSNQASLSFAVQKTSVCDRNIPSDKAHV